MNFSIKPMLVTPKYAEELLKMNVNNRKVRQSKVDSLAESMTKGEWELSNDAIVISEGNILLNGQHRLLAVVKSGVACNFILFTGASDSSFEIMDTPSMRKIADVIKQKGGTYPEKCETAINRYLSLCYDLDREWKTTQRFRNEPPETRKTRIAAYEEHKEDLLKWVSICNKVQERNLVLVASPLLAAFGMFLEKRLFHSEKKILEFFKELLVEGAAKNSTIIYARKKLIRHKMKLEVLPRWDNYRLVISAWNDFVLGKERAFIKTAEEGFINARPY